MHSKTSGTAVVFSILAVATFLTCSAVRIKNGQQSSNGAAAAPGSATVLEADGVAPPPIIPPPKFIANAA